MDGPSKDWVNVSSKDWVNVFETCSESGVRNYKEHFGKSDDLYPLILPQI